MSVSSATASSLTVSWSPSTDNVGVTGYDTFLGTSNVGTTASTSYTFTGLSCGTTYTVGVDARDQAGNVSPQTTMSATTASCAPGPSAGALGSPSVGPDSDYNPPGWAEAFGATASASGPIGGLRVYVDSPSTASTLVAGLYADAAGAPGSLIAQGSVSPTAGAWNSVPLSGVTLTAGKTYWIAILGSAGTLYYRDSCCSSGSTAYVSSATTLSAMPSQWAGSATYNAGPVSAYAYTSSSPADTTPPTAPGGLKTTGSTQSSVSLSWNASTDNVGVTRYDVSVNGSTSGSTASTSYTATGLACGTTYTFAVDAVDAAGNQSPPSSIAASTSACSSGPPPAGGVFVSPSGSDANPCTASAPCASFDRAYHVALPGQTVSVAGGSYPDQTLGADATKTGPAVVTFQPAAGSSVSVADLYVEGASYVKFTNMTVGFRFHVENADAGSLGSTNVTFDSVNAQTFDIIGRVANVTVHGGVFGNTTNHQPQVSKYNQSDPDASEPQNVVIENGVFQNFRASDPSVHTECLQVLNANNLTIRDNKFSTCDSTGDLGLTCEPGTTGVTVENNWLMAGGSPGYGAQISGDCANLRFRYNSATLDVFFADTVTGKSYRFVGNYLPSDANLCRSDATYSHNVIRGGSCGATDTNVGSLDFVSASDLHLKAGANAIDRGDPSDYPPTDIDGQTRPLGAAPDAGADEAG